MIKTRVIPTLLYKDYTLVKGAKFDSWRRVGSLMQAIKVYNLRQVDELVFLDITATLRGGRPDFDLVDDFADECFMPLSVGGGVASVDDVRRLLQCGADKVIINTAAVLSADIIKEAAEKFGSQCIVVSIDAKKNAEGKYEVYTHSGSKPTGKDPAAFAKEMQGMGAGEILITSIDRDGLMKGYDLDLIDKVAAAVSIPVIASGGAGSYKDMLEAITQCGVSAVAAASIFHFTEMTPLEAKIFLRDRGVDVRIQKNKETDGNQ